MANLGRPEKPIDWEQFEDLCSIQCTHDELSAMCHVAKSTLYERAQKKYGEDFPTIYKRFSGPGKCSLRRTQFKLANKNPAMAIWLGKQWLGQKDYQEKDESPKQEDINLKQKYYAALYENQKLKETLNAIESKAS